MITSSRSAPGTHEYAVEAIRKALGILYRESLDGAVLNEETRLFGIGESAKSDGGTDLDLDSLDMLQLVLILENDFGLVLADSVDPRSMGTIGGIAGHLVAETKKLGSLDDTDVRDRP
jgi:acyl carrier protein